MQKRHLTYLSITFFLLMSFNLKAQKIDWSEHEPASTKKVDHSLWQSFLDTYLKTKTPSGVHLLDYRNVDNKGREQLIDYIHQLRTTDPATLGKAEQMAFWINLYNALTVKLILENYPVTSIKKTGNSFFSFGPWDDDIIKLKGSVLSLNNIEHDILRPIFKDKRIHYAVNCASIGCPDLAQQAYNGEQLESQLQAAACQYINHPRGVHIKGDTLILSKIYTWYEEDFGTKDELLDHFLDCAQPLLQRRIRSWISSDSQDIDYDYDWSLNDYKDN